MHLASLLTLHRHVLCFPAEKRQSTSVEQVNSLQSYIIFQWTAPLMQLMAVKNI